MEAMLLHNSAEYSDEDYIDMEVNSQTTNMFSQHSKASSADLREFEFQMFSNTLEKDTTTSPADELFYKGKLLPLHLPPRLQMVQKLLQNPNTYDPKTSKKPDKTSDQEESFGTPLFTPAANNTPFESCNVSPVESCLVSRELNPDEYLYEFLGETDKSSSSIDQQCSKRSWTKRLKLIKQSGIGSKLKASRAYIKSFFNKSTCSDKSSIAAIRNFNEQQQSVSAMKTAFGQIQKGGYHISSFRKEDKNDDNEKGCHRRSFSGAIKRLSLSSSSSSKFSGSDSSSASSSNNSNGFQEMQFFKASINPKLEIESPIQAAIAHCKRSQQQFHPRKTVSDVGICSLSASRIINEDQERPGLCRG